MKARSSEVSLLFIETEVRPVRLPYIPLTHGSFETSSFRPSDRMRRESVNAPVSLNPGQDGLFKHSV